MRLWPLVIALVVWTASLSASNAAETSSGSSVLVASHPDSSHTGPSPKDSARPIYFGVMGEVAHPGAYAAPAVWTLTELIKKAGGITPQANKSVRIFRGGLLTEQVFLGSGEAPSLLPNDLIVVGDSGSSGSPTTSTDVNRGSSEPAAVSAVQVAFVNLIDRPVIVKMPSDKATLARIVELLGQPADSAANIRIFAPLAAGPHDSDSIEQATRPLDSGTVLVFSAPSIRRETLPAFPEPIAKASSNSPVALSPRPPDSKPADSSRSDRNQATTLPGDSKGAGPSRPLTVTVERPIAPASADQSLIDRGARSSDIVPHSSSEFASRPSVQTAGAVEAGMIEPLLAYSPREPHRESRAGRMVALMAVMSAVAGLAMLLTFASIVQRWMESGKLPFRRVSGTAPSRSANLSASTGVPMPPVPASLAGRPIRIDAGQPITRLSVDLAAIERAPHSASTR
jgi:hypothetical protein